LLDCPYFYEVWRQLCFRSSVKNMTVMSEHLTSPTVQCWSALRQGPWTPRVTYIL
jgi:hypothetical protein